MGITYASTMIPLAHTGSLQVCSLSYFWKRPADADTYVRAALNESFSLQLKGRNHGLGWKWTRKSLTNAPTSYGNCVMNHLRMAAQFRSNIVDNIKQ